MIAKPLRTVLYADDDPDIREIVRISLGLAQDLEVHTAPSGERALALARELQPDLVMLDVMMPGLDGPGTFRRMRKDPGVARIPVIFMTAKAMPNEVAVLMEMGALGVIGKPFDPMLLVAQVTALWQGRPAEPPSVAKVADDSGLHQEVRKLGDRFLQRTREEAVRLRNLIELVHQGDMVQIEELKSLAHRIRGSGSTFGFVAVSECARDIERAVDGLRDPDAKSGSALESEIRRRLSEHALLLIREVEAAVVR
jgi:DNA-binding response OmpR family regulator